MDDVGKENEMLEMLEIKLVKVCLVDVPYYFQWCQEGAL